MERLAQPDRLFSQGPSCQGWAARADGEEDEVEAEMGGERVVLMGGDPWHSWPQVAARLVVVLCEEPCFPMVSLQVAVQPG